MAFARGGPSTQRLSGHLRSLSLPPNRTTAPTLPLTRRPGASSTQSPAGNAPRLGRRTGRGQGPLLLVLGAAFGLAALSLMTLTRGRRRARPGAPPPDFDSPRPGRRRPLTDMPGQALMRRLPRRHPLPASSARIAWSGTRARRTEQSSSVRQRPSSEPATSADGRLPVRDPGRTDQQMGMGTSDPGSLMPSTGPRGPAGDLSSTVSITSGARRTRSGRSSSRLQATTSSWSPSTRTETPGGSAADRSGRRHDGRPA